MRTGELWAGSPAKKMRELTVEEVAYIGEAAELYADYAEQYRLEAKSAAE